MMPERLRDVAAWRLRDVAVLGAGGKMGSGIAWVALKAMADLDARENGAPGSGKYALALIDANRAAFPGLRQYLKTQLQKAAEKSINELRAWAADRPELIENAEVIQAYVDGALSMLRCEGELSAAKDARLIFEAVFEDLALKKDLYARLKALCGPETFFFTNTSSIPISLLDESAGLDGRLLGFHFYNPPAVQKLVELIAGKRTRPEAAALGQELGKIFGKIVVPSNDVAGFIGNGHFIREGLFALRKLRAMMGTKTGAMGGTAALVAINRTTQESLIRPMGIFQLMDYVGLDVFQMIVKVMRGHLEGAADRADFADATLDAWLAAGVRGGQLGSGEQKDGIFKYERNKIVGVYDSKRNTYVTLEDARAKTEAGGPAQAPGAAPEGYPAWSTLAKDPKKREKAAAALASLSAVDKGSGTPVFSGAGLAREFLDHSRAVSQALVRDGVAASDEDVAKVLMNGFFHLYGPADWKG